jgi:PPOX class probable F420-dependent enzyme
MKGDFYRPTHDKPFENLDELCALIRTKQGLGSKLALGITDEDPTDDYRSGTRVIPQGCSACPFLHKFRCGEDGNVLRLFQEGVPYNSVHGSETYLYDPIPRQMVRADNQRQRTKRNIFVMILNDTVRQALTSGHNAHLVTLNPDGSPQVSLVWVGLDADEIVCAHLSSWKKVQNIQRDARVALSLETGGKTEGAENYLVITGRARITEGGAPELLYQLAQVYKGPGAGTQYRTANAPGYITHIEVEHVYGVGPWKTQP